MRAMPSAWQAGSQRLAEDAARLLPLLRAANSAFAVRPTSDHPSIRQLQYDPVYRLEPQRLRDGTCQRVRMES